MAILTFSDEERAEQASGNLAFFELGTLGWIRKRRLDLDDYCRYLGEVAAPGWGTDHTATTIASYIALNIESSGVMTATAEGDDSEARVRATGPDEAALAEAGADAADARDLNELVFRVIVEHLGFTLDAQQDGDSLILTIRPAKQG